MSLKPTWDTWPSWTAIDCLNAFQLWNFEIQDMLNILGFCYLQNQCIVMSRHLDDFTKITRTVMMIMMSNNPYDLLQFCSSDNKCINQQICFTEPNSEAERNQPIILKLYSRWPLYTRFTCKQSDSRMNTISNQICISPVFLNTNPFSEASWHSFLTLISR